MRRPDRRRVRPLRASSITRFSWFKMVTRSGSSTSESPRRRLPDDLVYEGVVQKVEGSDQFEALAGICGGDYKAEEIVRLRRIEISETAAPLRCRTRSSSPMTSRRSRGISTSRPANRATAGHPIRATRSAVLVHASATAGASAPAGRRPGSACRGDPAGGGLVVRRREQAGSSRREHRDRLQRRRGRIKCQVVSGSGSRPLGRPT